MQPSRLPPRSLSRPWATFDQLPALSTGEQLQWERDHPNEMRPWDRPGAISRTAIPRSRFIAQRPEIQVLSLTSSVHSPDPDPVFSAFQ